MEYIIRINDNDLIDSDGNKRIEEIKELVRCKDCKHYSEGESQCLAQPGYFPVDDNWYCADGERKVKEIGSKRDI